MDEIETTSRRIYPRAPLVSVGATIQKEREILLIRRANEPGKGLWSIPGGLVEVGETVRDTAKREVEEETGIGVELGDLIDVIDNIVRDEAGKVKFHYVLIDFIARPASLKTEIRPSSEVLEARWFAPVELKELSLTRTAQRLLKKIGVLS